MRSALSIALLATLAAGGACAASVPTPATPNEPAAATPGSAGLPPGSAASSVSNAESSPPADAGLALSAPASPAGSGETVDASAPSLTSRPGALASTSTAVSTSVSACNEQPPQDFLIRGNFLKEKTGNDRAIQYRTEQYGYFKGFGHPAPGAQPPSASLVSTTFMGLPVRMHRKVAPALACVEQEIRNSCGDHPYTPHALAGIRYRNTYRGGEVTNHAYGIAIDVDPDVNTCCGCVPPWNDAPACKRKGKSEYDHMAMPECWVHAFERFGFYWLGHDVLKDTMHFEFLGDPDKISKAQPSAQP